MSRDFNADRAEYNGIFGLNLTANDLEHFAAGWQSRDKRAKTEKAELIAELSNALANAASRSCSHDAEQVRAAMAKALHKAASCN